MEQTQSRVKPVVHVDVHRVALYLIVKMLPPLHLEEFPITLLITMIANVHCMTAHCPLPTTLSSEEMELCKDQTPAPTEEKGEQVLQLALLLQIPLEEEEGMPTPVSRHYLKSILAILENLKMLRCRHRQRTVEGIANNHHREDQQIGIAKILHLGLTIVERRSGNVRKGS